MTTIATWIITGPLFPVILFSVALATATLLVRHLPLIRRNLITIETNRASAIDGLRGCLGIGVFIHHAVITWYFIHGDPWRLPSSPLIIHLGQSSVALFFMITAFLFWGRVLDRGGAIDWAAFFVSRLYRLYPVYLLMMALVLAAAFGLQASGPPVTFYSVLRPLLDWLLFTMFATPDFNGLEHADTLVAGVLWSLRYEWLFYLALPLAAMLTGRAIKPVAAGGSLVILILMAWRFGWRNPFDIGILRLFLGGIVAAHWVRFPALSAVGRSVVGAIVALMALAGVVAFCSSAYDGAAGLGLTVFFIAVASGNDFWGAFRAPGLLWLGDITYPIYLFHGLFLWFVFRHALTPDIASQGVPFLGFVILIDIVLILVCSFVFVMIERPAIAMGKRHYRAMHGRYPNPARTAAKASATFPPSGPPA